MDKCYVKSVVDGLKSSSSNKVQESLHKIRSKISSTDAGIKLFRDCDGLEYLLPHLRKPNERVLDLTLSILGNCCLDDECSIAVGKLNTFAPLISILKTVCRDSIVGRTCRLIGNLAQKSLNAEGLHNHGAVSALTSLIENRDKNTSYPTLTMAVRAIRQLWMLTEKRDDMLALNVGRCIAVLLTTECELAGIIKSSNLEKETEGLRRSQEELIKGILKCLGYFTTHPTSHSAEQIQGDGRGYQCLVALTKSYETLALKCLMNLCYLSCCRPLLGTAGLVECLVEILQKKNDVSMWPEGATRALAHLSGESVNRSRLRHCGGLPLLVAAARISPHAIHALLQYVFDDISFQILVNGGLISLLTEELINYLTTMNVEHNVEIDENIIEDVSGIDKATKKLKLKSEMFECEGASTSQSHDNCPNNKDLRISFNRSKSQISSKDVDELKVVIERDNMIVGFIDAVDSDASDETQSGDENIAHHNKSLKRARSRSPKMLKKKPQLIRMASKDWSAGVYWEPKSPEWSPNCQQIGSCGARSPERTDQNMLSPYSDGNQSGFSPEYSGHSSKRPRWDWSPESGIGSAEGNSTSSHWTENQWSPSSSSSPTSPFSNYEEASSDSEMSGRYSPICSEAEGEASNEIVDLAVHNKAAVPVDEVVTEDDDGIDDETPLEEIANKVCTNVDTKTSRIACVLVLLFRLSHGACSSFNGIREEPVSNHTLELLTGQECLNALLDYVERCRRPLGRAARILAKLLSNALCLMSILKHRVALRLYNMSVTSKHPSGNCQQCKQIMRVSSKLLNKLTILAESSYGIGEISYQLLKGSSDMKITLSLTLPYIVRTEKLLKRYFIEYNALNLLFTAIGVQKENLKDCVTALSKLAINVHIKDPKTLESRFKDQICVSYDPILDDLSVDSIVTFELDDHTTVKANKVFLCQNSEFFSAMLMGCFKESIEKCVRLRNVTKPALEYLFTLLQFGLNHPKSEIQIFPMAEKLETNLEVLLLADKFLFEKLKILLTSAIVQFQMKPETADKIYVWSLNDGMGFLCVESVAYLLTGKMSELDRSQCFKCILDMKYKEQWLDDIKSIILRQLEK